VSKLCEAGDLPNVRIVDSTRIRRAEIDGEESTIANRDCDGKLGYGNHMAPCFIFHST
jgi:hypothetical protein